MTVSDDGCYPIKVVSGERVRAEDVSTLYAGDRDRYIVSFIVGYDDKDDAVANPYEAARLALSLTTDPNSKDTVWRVYDRETEETFEFTQRELDPW